MAQHRYNRRQIDGRFDFTRPMVCIDCGEDEPFEKARLEGRARHVDEVVYCGSCGAHHEESRWDYPADVAETHCAAPLSNAYLRAFHANTL